jgi:homoserine kinase type II
VFFTYTPEAEMQLTGVIDFYFACNEFWMYDLAIVLNAWCFDAKYNFLPGHARALFDAYRAVRPVTPEEIRALPALARGAALRFLLTRAHDLIFHPPDALVTPKDPKEYLAKLTYFRAHGEPGELGLA